MAAFSPTSRSLGAAGVLAGLLAARAGLADGPQGIAVGARTGYGIPLGDLAGGQTTSTTVTSMGSSSTTGPSSAESDTISGQVPIWLDAGYRFGPHIYLGGYFAYGFGLVPTNVCNGMSCSIHDMRFGADIRYHFAVSHVLDPWVGLGVGYEILGLSSSESVAGQSVSISETLSGFEFANVQAGADYQATSYFSMGPFAMFSLGEYASLSANGSASGMAAESASGSISSKAFHEWLMFGVRGEFTIRIGSSDEAEEEPSPSRDKPPPSPAPAPPPSPPPVSPATLAPGPPVAPGAWPRDVPLADRNACTLDCFAGDTMGRVDSAQASAQLGRQLRALRACALASGGHEKPRLVIVRFNEAGQGELQYDTRVGDASFAACTARIPPPSVTGPPQATFKCTDYCE